MKRKHAGFTVIELCVVLAVLALFILVFHASAGTRPASHAARCLNNLRQLMNAWRMYSDDYSDGLVPNHSGPTAGTPAWVGGMLDYGTRTDNTNINYLITPGSYGAFLGPYVKSPSFFKCPEDKSTALIASTRMPRVRSLSMNGWVGQGTDAFTTGYRTYQKISDLTSPSPANLWVIMDEQEDSINDGWFATSPSTSPASYTIYDYPAGRHDRAAAVSFADGRAELHQWRDPRTLPPVRGTDILFVGNTPSNQDVAWLYAHSTARIQ